MAALQDIRIKHRWDAIDIVNLQIKQAKPTDKIHKPEVFDNGDTRK